MHIVIDLSLSLAKLTGLALAVLVASAAYTTLRRLYLFTQWINDVDGPPSRNYWIGHYADFNEGDIVNTCLGWIKEYGGAVRHKAFLGEPRLLLTDPVALEHMFVKHPYTYTKQPEFGRFLVAIMGRGLLAAEGDVHKRQKRAIQAGFAPQSIRAYYPIFLQHSRHLRDKMRESIDNPNAMGMADQKGGRNEGKIMIDVLKASARASVDILAHACFGRSFDALSKDNQFGKLRMVHDDPSYKPSSDSLTEAFDSLVETASLKFGGPARIFYDVATMFVPILNHLPWAMDSDPRLRKSKSRMDDEAMIVLKHAEEAERERIELLRAEKSLSEPPAACDAEKHLRAELAMLESSDAQIKQSPEHPASVVSYMMRARDLAKHSASRKREKLSNEDLLGQVTTLMMAGHETTATTLAWMMRALAQHQQGQDELRRAIVDKRLELRLAPVSRAWAANEGIVVPEDDTDADAGRELTLDEMESIEHLDWAVQEMLRLYSPIHTSSRTAMQDDVLPIDPLYSPSAPREGIRVRKGLTIIIPIEAMNHDPQLWGDDAEQYKPQRWGDDTLPGVRRFRAQKGGASFLFGPRGCIGMRFSVTELKTILSVLLPGIRFLSAERPVTRARWIVARPWDPLVGHEQCPVRIARV